LRLRIGCVSAPAFFDALGAFLRATKPTQFKRYSRGNGLGQGSRGSKANF
jgi:hypothetical protein